MDLPLWLAQDLFQRGVVHVKLPRCYNSRFVSTANKYAIGTTRLSYYLFVLGHLTMAICSWSALACSPRTDRPSLALSIEEDSCTFKQPVGYSIKNTCKLGNSTFHLSLTLLKHCDLLPAYSTCGKVSRSFHGGYPSGMERTLSLTYYYVSSSQHFLV